MSETAYSDAQLDSIAKEIVGRDTAKARENQTFFGKYCEDNWDNELFISEECYENYLRAVQQGAKNKYTQRPYTRHGEFEDFLKDSLETLRFRLEELASEVSWNLIDHRTYNNAKMVNEMAMEAISKYLELPETARLIGI